MASRTHERAVAIECSPSTDISAFVPEGEKWVIRDVCVTCTSTSGDGHLTLAVSLGGAVEVPFWTGTVEGGKSYSPDALCCLYSGDGIVGHTAAGSEGVFVVISVIKYAPA